MQQVHDHGELSCRALTSDLTNIGCDELCIQALLEENDQVASIMRIELESGGESTADPIVLE
jgi:hypothetical protein